MCKLIFWLSSLIFVVVLMYVSQLLQAAARLASRSRRATSRGTGIGKSCVNCYCNKKIEKTFFFFQNFSKKIFTCGSFVRKRPRVVAASKKKNVVAVVGNTWCYSIKSFRNCMAKVIFRRDVNRNP